VPNTTVGSWLDRRLQKSGHRPAVIFEDKQFSYAALHGGSVAAASLLSDFGVGKGDRVAYLGENHPVFLQYFFGALRLGAVFVPLNTRLATPELAYMLDDSGAKVLITASAFGDRGHKAVEASSSPETKVVDASPDLLTATTEQTSASLTTLLEDEIQLADPAIILYTSGTTGKPKGALLSHNNLTWNALNVLIDYDLTSDSVSLVISPMFHVASLGMGILPSILKGATVVLEEKFDAGKSLELIAKHGVTAINGVPTTFQLMSEHESWNSTDLSKVRQVTCGGSPISLAILERYEARGLSFTGGYGMTEAAAGVTSLQSEFSKPKIGSAGLPHFFTNLRIADTSTGATVPAGIVGEIRIKGSNTISAYWRNEVATGKLRDNEGWLETGDMGYLDEQGFLYVVDRLKDMIISGGENVYPAEIESIANHDKGIASCAAIGIDDPRWGEVPVLVVCQRTGKDFDAQALRENLLSQLAKYKVPKRYFLVETMPRTASGKIQKNILKEMLIKGQLVEIKLD